MSSQPLASFEAQLRGERRILVPSAIRHRLGIGVDHHLTLRVFNFTMKLSITDRFKVVSNFRVTLEKNTHCVQLNVDVGDYVFVEVVNVDKGEIQATDTILMPEVQ